MEYKKLSKTIGTIKRIPLPFKMKKYKENDLRRNIILLKGNKSKSKTTNRLSNNENENKENKNFIKEKSQNIILKRNKTIENKINIKKYDIIPIISHNSEKPSHVFEENSSGKLYPSFYSFNKDNKKVFLKEKKYKQIPIVVHKSELPSISFEETYGGKINSSFPTSMTKYAKKFDEIPIIIHESEKPSICCEETYGGKIYSNF